MSYYSAQARNGAYKPHDVTFATFAEGKRIEKLSSFKTPETAHLWKDDIIESPKKEKAQKVKERKTGVARHNRTIPKLIEEDCYKTVREAVEIVGGHVSTIRDWIMRGYLKDVKKIKRADAHGFCFVVNMKELTTFMIGKRTLDGNPNEAEIKKRRAYSLDYYHKHKKLKFIREGQNVKSA
jgi:hypothetical protein